MALKKKPVNGMKDITPREMEIRSYVQGIIRDTYASYGYTQIETPCMEDIGNLTSKQGGENEKLIFKVLKRGEKLKLESAKSEEDLVDYGMRYDLTVPLCRYFACHENDLPAPFKALQMGNVWRADRPQRGRYRQFMQCDIDNIGEPSILAETELILAAAETLSKIGFKDFEIRINERRYLRAMAAYSGFPEEDFDKICIILDKMDKIGAAGVEAELSEAGYTKGQIGRYMGFFAGGKACEGCTACSVEPMETEDPVEAIEYMGGVLGDFADAEVTKNMTDIVNIVSEAGKDMPFKVVFDPTLVRGMSYYTGTIFEISLPELGISCGGGGRYDHMVGRFTGRDVPACGVSIGFERIILILMENGFTVPGAPAKKAYLIEKGTPSEKLAAIYEEAGRERAAGAQVLVARMNKNKKFQKEKLSEQGYTDIKEFFNN